MTNMAQTTGTIPKGRHSARNSIQLFIVFLSLLFLILALVRNWASVQEATGALDRGQFLVAVGLLMIMSN